MFVLAVMGRRAGKSHAGCDLAGRMALRTHQEIPWVTPSDAIGKRLRQGTFRPMWEDVIDQTGTVESPTPIVRLLGGGSVSYHSTHGKYTKAGGGKGIGILGGGFPLVILDEGARMPWGLIEEEIIPTLADCGGKLLIPTTPKGKRNWIYQKIYQKHLDGHPAYRVIRGPSTANPNPQIRRFVEWARQEMEPLLFRQEILAEFIEGQGTVFRNLLECATLAGFRRRPVEDCSYTIGCDVAKHQDWTVLVAIEETTGEVHGFDRFQGVSWPLIEGRIASFAERWGGTVWLDSTGVGDPVYDHLAQSGVNVQGVKFTSDSKAQLVQALAIALDREEIAYPNEDVLIGELDAFDYEILPSGRFRYGAPEGLHDDIVMALALAVYGRANAITGVPL